MVTRPMLVSSKSLMGCLSVLVLPLVLGASAYAQATAADGRKVYEKYCIGCHGDKGDGKGTVAADLITKPRDFTLGLFKFKSTPRGSLPTDDDLKKVMTNGLPTSAMPSFRLLGEAEKDELVAYIKSLSDRWKNETAGDSFPEVVAPDYVGTPDSVRRGEKLFAARCQMCHGTPTNIPDVVFCLKWKSEADCEDTLRPTNFTYGIIKRGPRVEDIFMSITAGVDGTPMLSFADLLSEDDRWDLTSYIVDFMKHGRR